MEDSNTGHVPVAFQRFFFKIDVLPSTHTGPQSITTALIPIELIQHL